MKRGILLAAAAACLVVSNPAPVWADGAARDENGIVLAESEELAREVLKKANEFRALAATEWTGAELPPSVGPVMIYPRLSETEEQGKTWRIDDPRRRYHTIWVTGTREAVLGPLLYHEVTHAVLATQLPEGVPAFLDEGIASRVDDESRIAIRRRILQWFAQTGNWPSLKSIMERDSISAFDQHAYAVAASVTEFLLTKGDKPTLLKFARTGKANGWSRALHMHYGMESVAQLEQEWRSWAEAEGNVVKNISRLDDARTIR